MGDSSITGAGRTSSSTHTTLLPVTVQSVEHDYRRALEQDYRGCHDWKEMVRKVVDSMEGLEAENKALKLQLQERGTTPNEFPPLYQTKSLKPNETSSQRAELVHAQQMLKKIEDAIRCAICLELPRRPCIVSPCGHSTCQKCLNAWFKSIDDDPDALLRRARTCPTCRAEITIKPLKDLTLNAVVAIFASGNDLGTSAIDDANEDETSARLFSGFRRTEPSPPSGYRPIIRDIFSRSQRPAPINIRPVPLDRTREEDIVTLMRGIESRLAGMRDRYSRIAAPTLPSPPPVAPSANPISVVSRRRHRLYTPTVPVHPDSHLSNIERMGREREVNQKFEVFLEICMSLLCLILVAVIAIYAYIHWPRLPILLNPWGRRANVSKAGGLMTKTKGYLERIVCPML